MPRIDPDYLALIQSDRVSSRTRECLMDRATADDPAYEPAAMSLSMLATLRAVVARVLPQPDSDPIDLGARIDALLASGTGDGWRFADLPPDGPAYRAALATLDDLSRALHDCAFAALDHARQDAMLALIADGAVTPAARVGLLDAAQMKLWFEDLRSDAVRLFVAHPATLARLGYSGIAYGGDGDAKQGFRHVGAGERESWEPGPKP
jgi:hypothetical protein